MYRYAQIEAAVARLHYDLSPSVLKSFRSRVRNLQRVGLVTSSPGRGQKITYTGVDAWFWAICFEFVELGLPPNYIKKIMDAKWDEISAFFEENSSEEKYFIIIGAFMIWSDEKVMAVLIKHATGIRTRADLVEGGIIDSQRIMMINLTSLKSGLVRYLSDELYLDRELARTSENE